LKRSHLVREIIEILVLAILIFFVMRFIVQSYYISNTSMQPTFSNQQHVMVNKVAYLFRGPERGDVIVFHNPQKPDEDLIARIIGLSGDSIKIDSSHVWVNNVLLKETYISLPANPEADTWHVPQGQFFVLGDNRPQCKDSRSIGFIPKDYMVGKAVLVFWPLNQIHTVDTYNDTYKYIKKL
jgi:signal peptidase I